jgi:hypothetical protein
VCVSTSTIGSDFSLSSPTLFEQSILLPQGDVDARLLFGANVWPTSRKMWVPIRYFGAAFAKVYIASNGKLRTAHRKLS